MLTILLRDMRVQVTGDLFFVAVQMLNPRLELRIESFSADLSPYYSNIELTISGDPVCLDNKKSLIISYSNM